MQPGKLQIAAELQRQKALPDQLAALRTRLDHLQRAERVTRVLCRRSGLVDGFEWGSMRPGRAWRPSAWHRSPPLPFHSFLHRGAGTCRVCGQPIYGGGSYRSSAGPVAKRLTWHTVCTVSYFLMTKPSDQAAALVFRQDGLCAITREPLGPPAAAYITSVDVDHEVPLFRVRDHHAAEPWYELIRFWGSGNLRAITGEAHRNKSATEARERAGLKIGKHAAATTS